MKKMSHHKDKEEKKHTEESGDEMDDMEDDHPFHHQDLLAALQSRDRFEMLKNLPPSVKRRLKALKKLQVESLKISVDLYKELHEVESRYHTKMIPQYNKRAEIASGKYEPNDEECDFPSDPESETEDEEGTKTKKESEAKSPKQNDQEVTGIPEFWLTIFKNVPLLCDMVQPHDEPILKHLQDIKIFYLSDPMGFKLEFYFSPNEYFTNTILTKEYYVKCQVEEDDPFSFDGTETYKCKGCTIDWEKGKNVTVKTVKKRQKHRARGAVRTICKVIPNDSFFNFFCPPVVPDDPDASIDEETQALMHSDFEIGHFLKERVIPRAVLYFTGEAIDEEEEEMEEEELEEEEDEDEETEKKHSKKPFVASRVKGDGPAAQPECKQQ